MLSPLAAQALRLHKTVELPLEVEALRPSKVLASSLLGALAGVESADLGLACEGPVVLEKTRFQITAVLNTALLQSMPTLRQLSLALNGDMAGDIDRWVAISTHMGGYQCSSPLCRC